MPKEMNFDTGIKNGADTKPQNGSATQTQQKPKQ